MSSPLSSSPRVTSPWTGLSGSGHRPSSPMKSRGSAFVGGSGGGSYSRNTNASMHFRSPSLDETDRDREQQPTLASSSYHAPTFLSHSHPAHSILSASYGHLSSLSPQSASGGGSFVTKPSSRVPVANVNEIDVGGDDYALPQAADNGGIQGDVQLTQDIRLSSLPTPLYGYLIGQLSTVLKFGVWWVGFSPLILAVFDGDSFLIGGARISFNLSLLLLSPLAGGIVERTHIKSVLNWTNFLRGFIYAILLPVFWIFLKSDVVWNSSDGTQDIFLIVFLILVFFDGVTVAFSNVADIDQGGTNLVAAQYDIPIDDNIRNYFNSLHIGFFDGSMVVFTPLLAGISLLIASKLHSADASSEDEENKSDKNIDILTILGSMGIIFFLSTVITLYYYNRYLKPGRYQQQLGESTIAAVAAMGSDGAAAIVLQASSQTPPPPPLLPPESDIQHDQQLVESESGVVENEENVKAEIPTFGEEVRLLASAIADGARITWKNHRVRWRLLFFALETSLEDAVISLIVPEFANVVLAPDETTTLKYNYTNLWVAAIIAAGKIGGVTASIIMNNYFRVTVDANGDTSHIYRPLFRFVFIGGMFALFTPLAFHIQQNTTAPDWVSIVVLFVGIFLFFLFSTLCKIGFSTLMQSMAAEADASGRMFGFIASFVTAVDALLLMVLSTLFAAVSTEYALWISCGFIALHGFVELTIGPYLVLQGSQTDQLQTGLLDEPQMDE